VKDFDVQRAARRDKSVDDRSFVIAGETFVRRAAVRPEVLNGFDRVEADSPNSVTLTVMDEMFLELVEGGEDGGEAEDRYRALRASTDPETLLTLEDLSEVVEWLVEEQVGRPTGSPSDSSRGQKRTGTTSTRGSSSPATQAA
jgi:hypothetical protein